METARVTLSSYIIHSVAAKLYLKLCTLAQTVTVMQLNTMICLNLPITEMDDEDCERRRVECLDEMTTLEKQFGDLKDQ